MGYDLRDLKFTLLPWLVKWKNVPLVDGNHMVGVKSRTITTSTIILWIVINISWVPDKIWRMLCVLSPYILWSGCYCFTNRTMKHKHVKGFPQGEKKSGYCGWTLIKDLVLAMICSYILSNRSSCYELHEYQMHTSLVSIFTKHFSNCYLGKLVRWSLSFPHSSSTLIAVWTFNAMDPIYLPRLCLLI